ncbi:MAG TPA: hypothetical protein EYO54_02635 [Candidatus Marinimicrobia bacterium]|nr:hypothetical protein [Candidatus Neomarinimicrobiota bacterium]
MIHLAISDSHLLCAQWFVKDGRQILTSFSYKALPRPLDVFNHSESEIISVLNAGLHLIREDILFEGDKVYVTIPDDYCKSVMVSVDSDLTENDGWEFAQWTINHRWPTQGSFQYYGRSFPGKSQSVFAVRVPTIFIEPIKLAIQELGGDPIWMGTESSAFFGLYPETGCTIFLPTSNGYRYYQYSQDYFQNGTARYIKNLWKLHSMVGSHLEGDVFKENLLFAGKLSEKRKANFKGRKIKQLTALDGVSLEGETLPKNIKEDDLYVLTAIATGHLHGVTLDFFNRPGLQYYQYEKPEVQEITKPERVKTEKKKLKKKKLRSKKKKIKKERNLLTPALYIFFFTVIAIMLTYDQKPELFDFVYFKNVDQKSEILSAPDSGIVPIAVQKDEPPKSKIPKFVIDSQSLISVASRTLQMTGSRHITLLSIGGGQMDLELVGDKTMDAPIDSLGDVLNYSLRQVRADSLFKHGYLVKYSIIDKPLNHSNIEIETLESMVSNIEFSFIKVLEPIEREGQVQTPIIVKISGVDHINDILLKLSVSGGNLALEKFVYISESENLNQSAIFYISLFSPHNSDAQE